MKERAPRQSGAFRFEDPRQRRIHERLLIVGPGPAAFFRDACRLMTADPSFESTTHLVSHSLREIESGLRDVLESFHQRQERTGKKPSKNEEDRHTQEIRAVLAALEIPETDAIARTWLDLAGTSSPCALHRRAHRDSLASPRPHDKAFTNWWDQMLTLLDVVLARFEARYLKILPFLEQLLTTISPKGADAKTLRNNVPNNLITLGYFFDHLEQPDWIGPLEAEGFFNTPPEPVRDAEAASVGFPFWPESRYLARMAQIPAAHDQVLVTALAIPDTDNTRVHEDLADIALKLPAGLAAKLVPQATRWIASPYHLLLPQKLGSLVQHLAEGAEAEAALTLARALFAVLPDPRSAEGGDQDGYRRSLPDPQPRFELLYYVDILKKCLPALVEAAGGAAFRMFCDLLESAVEFSMKPGARSAPEDYSHVWIPEIKERGPIHRGEIKNALVMAVRNSAEQLAYDDPTRVPVLVEDLESRPWKVYRRIALHLLWKFPGGASGLIADRLSDRTLLDDVGVRPEYYLLSEKCFARLTPNRQQMILDWIEQGPVVQGPVVGDRQGELGEDPAEAKLHLKRWQRNRLAPLRESLPEEWAARYEALVAQLGPPAPPILLSRFETFAGPVGPKSAEDLRRMSVDDLLDFLAGWVPSDSPLGPSREGLGRDFTALVASNPEPYASEAPRFQGLHPTYVHALFWGLGNSLKAKRHFSWEPVLELGAWAIRQTSDSNQPKSHDGDADWEEVRRAIGGLIDAGFEAGDTEIGLGLRSTVWAIVRELSGDPDPTPERDARYADSNADPVGLWINTVRGQAIHAVVRYALWIRQHLEREPDAPSRLARGFDGMPEVREVLDHHLSPERDPSPSVRSIYGQWFPRLVLLDRSWAELRADRIFPTMQEQYRLWRPAWEAYMAFCTAYEDVFDVLRAQYRHAIVHMGESVRHSGRLADSDEHLAEHLMILYWRGKLSLEEHDGHLTLFYQRASPSLRAHAMEFVGRSLSDTPNDVPTLILQRVQELWFRRLAAAKKGNSADEFQAELSAFGWWYSSGKFPEEWALNQLKAVLDLTDSVDMDQAVVERLSGFAATYPLEVVRCLDAIVSGDRDGWGVHRWKDHAKSILQTAIAAANDDARETAIALIHRLGARGHFDFRELLPSDAPRTNPGQ